MSRRATARSGTPVAISAAIADLSLQEEWKMLSYLCRTEGERKETSISSVCYMQKG